MYYTDFLVRLGMLRIGVFGVYCKMDVSGPH